MLARTSSYLLQGIDALFCEVEVDFDDRDDMDESRTNIVGLPDAAVRESMDRVRAALFNSGAFWPKGRTLINLAPADNRKEGPLYDLPIAVALLMIQNIIPQAGSPIKIVKKSKTVAASAPRGKPGNTDTLQGLQAELDGLIVAEPEPVEPLDVRQYLIAGELALDGRVRPIKGVIAMASLAKNMGLRGVIVPKENAAEAAVVPGVEAIGVSTLMEVIGLCTGRIAPEVCPPLDIASVLTTALADIDFGEVKGQEGVKRAITIAAAGGHNLLMLGPAGTGKSMMAKALPGVLPPLSPEEAIEITRIYSAAGALPPGKGLVTVRPVRTPHHTASGAAVIGGGSVPKPGEVSLAHRGVLFLDELPEFPREVLETLRQPLEDHVVTIARSHSAVRFPANFMLVAAMNPTPKGDVPHNEVGRKQMERYLAKLSGPLIDRIDIHVEAPAVPWKQLTSTTANGTTSAQMRETVLRARARQIARQGAMTPNSRLGPKKLDALAPMTDEARATLGTAMTELGLSARAYDKIRRVARTIADMEGVDMLTINHIGEAIGYRLLDRKV